jgi:hypothetical protein
MSWCNTLRQLNLRSKCSASILFFDDADSSADGPQQQKGTARKEMTPKVDAFIRVTKHTCIESKKLCSCDARDCVKTCLQLPSCAPVPGQAGVCY